MESRELPEGTIEEIRQKINCFQAEVVNSQQKRRGMEIDESVKNLHVALLFQKLRDAILAGHKPKKVGARDGRK